jgi:hypothetical protein
VSWARLALGGALTLSTALASGCGADRPAGPATPAAGETELHDGPLTDYVPAAGLRWLAVAQLDDLAKSKELAPSLELLFPKQRVDAFRDGSGIDLRDTPEAMAAGFDFATVYAARTDRVAVVEEKFATRVVTDPKITSPHPLLRAITGLVGSKPETLLTFDQRWVMVSVGSRTPIKVAALFATKRLKKTVPALSGAALSDLPDSLHAAPLRIYAPGPFEGAWTRGAASILASAIAVGVAAEPAPDQTLRLTIHVAGAWTDIDDKSRLAAAWTGLAEDPLGRLLSLDEPAESPEFSSTPELLTLKVRLRAGPLAQGLRAAVVAEVDEIFGLEKKTDSESDFKKLDSEIPN